MITYSSTRKSTLREKSASLARPQTPPSNLLQQLQLPTVLVVCYCTNNNHSSSTTMSSLVSRRSNRNRPSATPVRSARNSEQLENSPAPGSALAPPPRNLETASASVHESHSHGTPRASRQTLASSSPLFFRSSPSNAGTRAIANDRMDVSSPLGQTSIAGSTPRGRLQPPGGTSIPRSSTLSMF